MRKSDTIRKSIHIAISIQKLLPAAIVVGLFFLNQGCGVKGDPQPPVTPVELGRGQPTYKKAFRDIRIERQQESEDNQSSDEEIKKKKFE